MRLLQFLQPIGRSGTSVIRVLGLGLLFIGALVFDHPRTMGAPPGSDPVDDLRQAIRLDRSVPLELRNLDALMKERSAFRRKNLTAKAAKVTSIGDLARALLLVEWEPEKSNIEPELSVINDEVRDDLFRRFEQGIQNIVKEKNLIACRSAANLVGKTAIESRRASDPGVWAQNRLKQFAPALVRLTELRDPSQPNAAAEVRQSAAEALGQLNGDPDIVVPALANMLDPKANETVTGRRTAASALANVMRVRNNLRTGQSSRTALPRQGIVQDVVPAGSSVSRVASRLANDRDREVGLLATEAIHQSAIALADIAQDVAPQDVEKFPPIGRSPTAEEARLIGDYAKDVMSESRELMPLMEALRDSGSVLAEVAADARRTDRARQTAFMALEQMGIARDKVLRRYESVPEDFRPRDKDKGEAQDKRFPTYDPLLDGLRAASQRLQRGIEADASVRLAAIDALDALGPYARSAVPAVNRSLTNESPFVRRSAARVLGKIGPVEGQNTVVRLAWLLENDPDLDVRLTAANALERYGPAAREAVPAAARTIAGRNDAEVRMAAIETLRTIGPAEGKKAVPALITALADPDVRVRREAAMTLFRFGADASSARDALERAANDPDLEVNRLANAALLEIVR